MTHPFPQYMTPLKKFNTALARKTLEYARQEHDDFVFDMTTWYSWVKISQNTCKTRACLAGTAVHLSPEVTEIHPDNANIRSHPIFTYGDAKRTDTSTLAQELLGLSTRQAERLFFECGDNTTALSMLERMIEMAENNGN